MSRPTSADLRRPSDPLPKAIEAFLLRELRTLRKELEAYPDEDSVWILPDGLPNSGGTLALHLAGNLRHYVGRVLGGSGYERDREREFAARGLTLATLLDEITEAESAVRETLPRLRTADLDAPFAEPIRDHHISTRDLLLQLAVHVAYHLGQLSYHRRIVAGDPRGVGALAAGELDSARRAVPAEPQP